MKTLAKLIARALFALRSVRPHHLIFAWLAVLTFARTPAYSALSTFIAADGTTAQNWNIGGPNGPTWTNSSGTSTISAGTAMGMDSPGAVNVGNNAPNEPTINIGDQSFLASNTINIGSATGAPTINIQTTAGFPSLGLSIESPFFNLNQPGPPFGNADGLILGNATGNPGTYSPTGFSGTAASSFTSPGQSMTLDGATVTVGVASTTTTIAGSSNVSIVAGSGGGQITALSSQGTSSDFVFIGPNSPASSKTRLTPLAWFIGAAEISGDTGGTLNLDGFPLVLGGLPGGTNEWGHNTVTFACGTGGTQTISAGITGGDVTTGTLSSNCVLDFSTNASTQVTLLNMTSATPGATFGIQFKNGSATKTFLSTSLPGTLAIVWTWGTNTLAVNY